MDMKGLVDKFVKDEKLSTKNALVYSGLGLSKTSGHINSVVSDVAFNGFMYDVERQKRIAEDLGEMLFHWYLAATTVEIPADEIIQQFINQFYLKNNITPEKLQPSILELMKHVKTDVKGYTVKKLKDTQRQESLNKD